MVSKVPCCRFDSLNTTTLKIFTYLFTLDLAQWTKKSEKRVLILAIKQRGPTCNRVYIVPNLTLLLQF